MKPFQVGSLALVTNPSLDWCNLGRLVRVVGWDDLHQEWVVETLGRPLKQSGKELAIWSRVVGFKEHTLASLGVSWTRKEEMI